MLSQTQPGLSFGKVERLHLVLKEHMQKNIA